MKRTLFLLLCCAPMFADSVVSTQLQGFIKNIPVCSGATSCHAVIGDDIGEFPPPQFASINADVSFTKIPPLTRSGPTFIPGQGDKQALPGSYLLNANLNTSEGPSYGSVSFDDFAVPKVILNASYNIPIDAGNVNVQVFYSRATDADNVATADADTLLIFSSQCDYSLLPTCTAGQYGGYSCVNPPELDFTVSHTAGISDLITFRTEASSFGDENNSVEVEAVLTAETPEPATLTLVGFSLMLVAEKRKRLLRKLYP